MRDYPSPKGRVAERSSAGWGILETERSRLFRQFTPPCTLLRIPQPVWKLDWRDGPILPEPPYPTPCHEHLGRTCARQNGRDGRPVGGLRLERQYRDDRRRGRPTAKIGDLP